ncbi:MAG: PDZ domain-containing protein, partial [Bacteroidota bacterium]
RRIVDPYLKKIRREAGISPDSLEDGEWLALKSTKLDTIAYTPEALLELIYFAYLQGDQAAAIYYLNKIKGIKALSKLQKHYVLKSLERVENPNIYDGAIGVMVFEILGEGVFSEAGINPGDIIVEVNGDTLRGPDEINIALAKSNKDQMHKIIFYQDGKRQMAKVKQGLPINGTSSTLIGFFPYTY